MALPELKAILPYYQGVRDAARHTFDAFNRATQNITVGPGVRQIGSRVDMVTVEGKPYAATRYFFSREDGLMVTISGYANIDSPIVDPERPREIALSAPNPKSRYKDAKPISLEMLLTPSGNLCVITQDEFGTRDEIDTRFITDVESFAHRMRNRDISAGISQFGFTPEDLSIPPTNY